VARRVPTLTALMTISMAGLCGAFTAGVGVSTYKASSRALWANLDAALLEMARTELASATDTGYVHVHEPEPQPLSFKGAPGYEKYVWIEDQHGNVVAHTANIGLATPVQHDSRSEREAFSGRIAFGESVVNGLSLRSIHYPLRDPDGERLCGVVGIPVLAVEDTQRRMAAALWEVGALAMLLSSLLAVVGVRWLTRPLRRLAKEASQIGLEQAANQIDVPGGTREVADTVNALNAMIARLDEMIAFREAEVGRQKRFLADVSHGLRTPVANILGTSEVALRKTRTEDEYVEALGVVGGEAKRLRRAVQNLLLLARAEQVGLEFERKPVVLTTLLCEAHGSFMARAEAAGIDLKVKPIDAVVEGDHEALRLALDNLLDNAVKHARSSIVISAEHVQDAISISVFNDGPPIAEAELESIFRRFRSSPVSRWRW
jgi:signal transduction histidine kinase